MGAKGSTIIGARGPVAVTGTTHVATGESNRLIASISAAARTDRGRRRTQNQDCVLCEVGAEGAMGVFAVADGMGGQSAGEVASAIAIQTLREELLPLLENNASGAAASADKANGAGADRPLTERVREAIELCNERILRHAAAHPETKGLGSTLTLAVVKGSLAIIGNIGDSRTYRVRQGEIESLTRDHSLVAHLAAIGQIEPDDIYSHPHRSYIYRALGSETEAQPDIFTERLRSGDTLLLCSDGLWEMVRDGSIGRTTVEAPSPDEAAAQLVELANGNGGEDNISVIVVKAE